MTAKEEFIQIYKENITREGSAQLLEWLEKTDFFTAPASTRYHCACENGLVMHSVSVYNTMIEKHFDEETDYVHCFMTFARHSSIRCQPVTSRTRTPAGGKRFLTIP